MSRDELYFVHPHPRHLWAALLHLAEYGAKAVVILHIWPGLATTNLFIIKEHLPAAVVDRLGLQPFFSSLSTTSMWKGRRRFRSLAVLVDFGQFQNREAALKPKFSPENCLHFGCFVCS